MISIPIPLTTRTERAVPYPDIGRRTWRWTLDLRVLGVALTQRTCATGAGHTAWHEAVTYVRIDAFWRKKPRWRVSWDSFYYDGEHRVLNLGFVSVSWGW